MINCEILIKDSAPLRQLTAHSMLRRRKWGISRYYNNNIWKDSALHKVWE